MVEPPGTAPGSDPFITCAFMSIVPVGCPGEDRCNIGEPPPLRKGRGMRYRGGTGRALRRQIETDHDHP